MHASLTSSGHFFPLHNLHWGIGFCGKRAFYRGETQLLVKGTGAQVLSIHFQAQNRVALLHMGHQRYANAFAMSAMIDE